MKIIQFGILFLALSLSPCLSLRFKGYAKSRQFIKPGNKGPLTIIDRVLSAESMGNHNVRRVQPLFNIEDAAANEKVYDVHALNLDKLKSLELDGSLKNYLELDAQGQNAVKKNIGFKVVNVNDLDSDRQNSKRSNLQKVKLVQSLEPPQNFFKNVPNRIINDAQASAAQSTHANLFANMNNQGKKRRSKSVFDKNGMMFMTKPKDSEGRKLTDLVNKIMQAKAEYDRGGLRQPTTRFTPNEMKQMRLIIQAKDEDTKFQDTDDELDQLLKKEELLGKWREDADEDEPVKVIVAELSAGTGNFKVLPNKLQINDIFDFQSGEKNTKKIAQLITQLLKEQKFDDDSDDDDLSNAKADIMKLLDNPDSGESRVNRKEPKLKYISRAIQEPSVDKPAGQHQFNFDELVA